MLIFRITIFAITITFLSSCGEDKVDITGQYETESLTLSNCTGATQSGTYGDSRGICFPGNNLEACVRIFWEFRENNSYSRTTESTHYLINGTTVSLGGGTEVGTYTYDGLSIELSPASGVTGTIFQVSNMGNTLSSISTIFSDCDAVERLERI